MYITKLYSVFFFLFFYKIVQNIPSHCCRYMAENEQLLGLFTVLNSWSPARACVEGGRVPPPSALFICTVRLRQTHAQREWMAEMSMLTCFNGVSSPNQGTDTPPPDTTSLSFCYRSSPRLHFVHRIFEMKSTYGNPPNPKKLD